MFNGNPHAPSTSWLETIAAGKPYPDDVDVGAEGTDTFDRGDDGVFEVTVRKVDPDAPDEDPEPMPNGIYLIADTPRSATPLAVEDGSGDRALLREALAEHDVDVVEPIRDPDGRVVAEAGGSDE